MKILIYVITFSFTSLTLFAQSDQNNTIDRMDDQRDRESKTDTTNVVSHFRTAWKWKHGGVFKKEWVLDTFLDGLHNVNPIFKSSISNTYLGNLPSPYEPNIFINRTNDEEFYPLNRLRAYLFKPEDALQFNTTTPYTQLSYFNGGGRMKSEDVVDVWHYQNIRSYWNAGFRYHLMSGDGSYMYQKSKTYNLAFFSNYEKEKWIHTFFINQNVGHYKENGGILDPYYLVDTVLDAQLIPTNLSQEPENNFYNFNLEISSQYYIGKGKEQITQQDSVQKDTTYSYPMKAIVTLKVEENQYKFKEKYVELEFFPQTYIDSSSNSDIVKNKQYELSTKFVINEHPKYKYLPGVYTGLTYKNSKYKQRIRIDQDTTTSDFGESNHDGIYLTAGTFNTDTNSLLYFDLSAAYCLLGDDKFNYLFEGEVTQFLNNRRFSYFTFNAALKNKTPNPFFSRYIGNHNIWENNFNKIKSYELRGKYTNKHLRTECGIALNNTNGYIYLDTAALPQQFDGNLIVFTAWIKEIFKLGYFHFDQQIYYQTCNKENILSLPQLSIYSHNYYQNRLFKNALGLQVGIDIFYNTQFYGDAYMPSIMQYYNQRKEKIGNYPKMDLFLNVNIKRADLFAKYEHFNEFFSNRKYFSAHSYALRPAIFKFGVRWNFYD